MTKKRERRKRPRYMLEFPNGTHVMFTSLTDIGLHLWDQHIMEIKWWRIMTTDEVNELLSERNGSPSKKSSHI